MDIFNSKSCDVCDHVSKTSFMLKKHEFKAHNIGGIECPICYRKFYNIFQFNTHHKNDHTDDFTFTKCYYCNKSTIILDLHKDDTFRCDKCQIVNHFRKNEHSEQIVYYKCFKCEYESQYRQSMRNHLERFHSDGNLECNFCFNKFYKLFKYSDVKGLHKICKRCHNTATGKDSRVEIKMSNFLDDEYGTDFCIATDEPIYGNVCQKYRPDKLYASPDRILHIECDEHQHAGHYSYTCEQERISDIYDEFPGKDYIIIRWNPHKYKTGINYSIEYRLKLLLDVMKANINIPNKILIIYMFYDPDNDVITKDIEKKFINNINDLNNTLDETV